jgi:RecA-family ATPase
LNLGPPLGSFKKGKMLDIESLLALPTDDHTYIIRPQLFPVKGKMYIVAPEKHNKTFLALAAAINISSGTPLWGVPQFTIDRPYRVGYFDKELGISRLKKRLEIYKEQAKNLSLFVEPREPSCLLSTDAGVDAIAKRIKEFNLDVIVLDPLAKFYPGAKENDIEHMGKIAQNIDRLADTMGVSTMILHHMPKPNEASPRKGAQRMRGSTALAADLDTYIELRRTSPSHHKTRIMKLSFITRDEPVDDLFLRIMPDGLVEYAGTDDPSPAAKATKAHYDKN